MPDLKAALADALDGLETMLGYVPDYFVDKYELSGYVERAKATLGSDTAELAALAGEATGALPTRVVRVLREAEACGWEVFKHCTLVIRLWKPCDFAHLYRRGDAPPLPFDARWDLVTDTKTGRRSWRFTSARAANGQALNYDDILAYLEDPAVIYPEPPEDD